ncbi:amidohydrolase [Streptomyces sp. ATCC 21386]|uniref:amidohydrolase family protein n=1 Tax=Streptomyces sp. ATCC 21386 TaxID=2699428 RepID=UPI001BFF6C88|nr:amidohydrolase [Streptomyces sp. ATCC 21386]
MTIPVEDTQWRHRRGLLPDGDPLVSALRELAGRDRTHTIRSVALIDARTGDVTPPRDLRVADGRITGWSPGPPADERSARPDWYAVPGFVDAHAHVSSVSDLVGLLVHGVTAYRQMWGEPAHLYSVGVLRARNAVLPRAWVTAGLVDGPNSRIPEAVTLVDGAQAARDVVEDVLAYGFDGIKIYDDLERPAFDLLVREAERAGVPVVGHVPEAVPPGAAHRVMRSSEHLYGIVPNVFRLPAADRWSVLADALERCRSDRHALTADVAGHFVCPTLTAWRARTGEVRFTQPSRTALQTAVPSRRRAWYAAARNALELDRAEAERRSALIDRLGLVARDVVERGARLLVGTDCGNPFVLAGPSYHKEMAELSRAGFGFGAILRAATADAHEVMGRRDEPGTGLADLVLFRESPAGDTARLARPDGVLIDGVLLDSGDLDRLWSLRLQEAGLDPSVWRRGDLNPPVNRTQQKEVTSHAG